MASPIIVRAAMPTRTRILVAALAIVAAAAFALGVQDGHWWSIGEVTIGPFGSHHCFGGACRATGADVPVCLDPRPRFMRGIGDLLSGPLDLPRLFAVLLNPAVAVATKDVFAALAVPTAGQTPPATICTGATALLAEIARGRNDLEEPAIELEPAITDALAVLRKLPGCRLARMSGSGATCFGLFDSMDAARGAARRLRVGYPAWWVRATALGG